MSAIVQELLRRPDLPRVMSELEEAVADEARRRAEYVEWLDDHTYAEFIAGEVVVHSPERWGHGYAEDNLKLLLVPFVRERDMGEAAGNKLVRTPRDDYIPDLCYWPKTVSDAFTDDTTIFPIPALVIEIISPSTEANDRGVKFEVYAACEVREYWLVDPAARRVEQYDLDPATKTFRLRAISVADQAVASNVLPGLAFPANAVFDAASNARAVAALGA